LVDAVNDVIKYYVKSKEFKILKGKNDLLKIKARNRKNKKDNL
jgi:hypothetical protein